MDLPGIVQLIHDSALSEWLRSSLKAMPIVEAIHVMTAELHRRLVPDEPLPGGPAAGPVPGGPS